MSHTAGVQPKGHSLSLQAYDQPAIRHPGLPFNGLRSRNPRNYMEYYSFTDLEGMEGCVGRVG